MTGKRLGGRPVWPLLATVVLLAAGAVIAIAARAGGDDAGEQLALWGMRNGEGAEAAGGVESEAGQRKGGESFAKDVRETAARIGGRAGAEGERVGPRTPWGEQVANRAYPRGYVDDRRARDVRRAFDRVPSTASRSDFRSGGAYRQAIEAAPDRWTLFGPTTPNVSGNASQFYNPVTGVGPATQEAGRIPAVAVDPACAPGDCRLWAATAGGGIWRTDDALAAKVAWTPPPAGLPTNAFGSILYDKPTDTLYAGSGEPNGSGDSEAGLGLFKSTDSGASWSLVPGSAAVATNRAIGSIALDPNDAGTLYIGTAVARHGSSSVNGGRRTPPGAPRLGVYKSTDGGASFDLQEDLSNKTPQNPTDPGAGTGMDWFQGGVHRLEFDPNDPESVYAGVLGYGVWRSDDDGVTWSQVFHTMNQTDFGDPEDPDDDTGDFFGDVSEFDLVDLGATTRAFLGDASDDFATDGDDSTPAPEVWRNDDVATIAGDPNGNVNNVTAGWIKLSNETNGTNGFLAYNWCQNGQCSYDSFVVSPPGKQNEVWLGGAMNYDELPAYAGEPPRSNGRAVIRSTNANLAPDAPTWQDMTAKLRSDEAWDVQAGLHPDEQALGFSADGNVAFVASDGGLARVNVATTENRTASCDKRRYVYAEPAGPQPLNAADLKDCKTLLNGIPSAITPINDGLSTLQFQSLSFNPKDPANDVLGGTQDNGTWSYSGTPAWFESVGGDGGQSGFDPVTPQIRYHNYFSATPEVNFNGNDDGAWLNIYDTLQRPLNTEARSFYTPFIGDPVTGGRAFTGLERVWRTDNNGGDRQRLEANCNALRLNPRRAPCGDWKPLGLNLTSAAFGSDRTGQYVVANERTIADAGTLWAATRTGRVFVAKNADAAPSTVLFERIDDDANTPGRFPSGIAIDPADPNHAFVSYSGYDAYTPSTPGHVFEVRYDPGSRRAVWTDRSANIGDQPVTSVAYAGSTRDLYAATDFGVLRLPAGSTQWVEAAADLPRVAVYGLSLSQCGGLLYAATHGRSAYALQLPGFVGTACGNNPPPPTPTPSPTATTTPPAGGGGSGGTPADRRKPTLRVRKVKRVRRPKKTTVRGRATDASGIRRVRIRWGDGRRPTTARLSRTGRFTVKHRYRKAKLHRIRVTATDRAGNSRTKSVRARVLKRRAARN